MNVSPDRHHAADIVYLDQNKWIELARARSGTASVGRTADLYSQLVDAVVAGRVLFPLSVSHILETSKRNDPVSRGHLAETQAELSRGYAYRSRAGRLRVEVIATLHRLFGLEPPALQRNWAVARGFLQAFEPMDELLASSSQRKHLARLHASIHPAAFYISFMKNQDDAQRRAAHKSHATGILDLVKSIEQRRERLVGETIALRRRAYAAQLFFEHQEIFISVLNDMGLEIEQLMALGDMAIRALVEEVPTLHVEAEMSARLESESRALSPNDVFDMQAFYTAIPYSKYVVAEKSSISRATQARLGATYGVTLSRSLEDLRDLYVG